MDALQKAIFKSAFSGTCVTYSSIRRCSTCNMCVFSRSQTLPCLTYIIYAFGGTCPTYSMVSNNCFVCLQKVRFRQMFTKGHFVLGEVAFAFRIASYIAALLSHLWLSVSRFRKIVNLFFNGICQPLNRTDFA